MLIETAKTQALQGPVGTGPKGSEIHDSEVSRVVQLEEFYRFGLQTRFREMVENWRMYLAIKNEIRRDKEKKWRANINVPYPYSVVETIASVMCDIMSAPDPQIQVEGLGRAGQDEAISRGLELLFDSTLRYNKWELQKALMFRTMPIQGTDVLKLIWKNVRRNVMFLADPKEQAAFKAAVTAAATALQQTPPNTPDEFEEWRQHANLNPERGRLGYPMIPAPPVSGLRPQVEYNGPAIERVPIFDLRFNPNIDSTKPLPWVAQRIVMKRDHLLRLSGPTPDKPYDQAQVEAAIGRGGAEGGLWTKWQDEVAQMMGLRSMANTDPYHQDDVELLEVWEPESEFPFKVILNRSTIINKKPAEMLYAHGHTPFHFIRNVPVAHQFLGMSEYQQSRRLFQEMDTLRSLRLDAVALQVLPIFLRLKDVGMSDLAKEIRPGMIVDAARTDGLKQLLNFHANVNDAFRENQDIKNDIDDTAATQPQVRGSQATMGRVSATEMQSRLNQALVRTKDRVVRAEEELSNIPKDALFLWYQFGDPVTAVRASGGDGDPFIMIPRDHFYDALNYSVRFRSASKILNKDMAAQQLQQYLTLASNLRLITLPEARKTLARWLELVGQKDVAELVSNAGTAQLIADQQAQAQAQQQQAQAEAQAQQKPPSTSINYKDLPPSGQEQLAAQVGLQLAPGEAMMAQQAAQTPEAPANGG